MGLRGVALVVVVGVVVALGNLTSSAAARPGSFLAFSDSASLMTATEYAPLLKNQRSSVCAVAGAKHEPGLSKALSDAHHFVGKHSSAHARGALAHKQGRHENSSEAFAAAALEAGKPQAALAALLDAHADSPKDPLPLSSASALLTNLGLPSDALALADAAGKLKPKPHPPLGIGVHAAALTNRGNALLAMGRWQQAAKSFHRAIGQAPALREADTGLAAADLCSGKPGAPKFLIAGATRQRFDLYDTGTPPSEMTHPRADEVFDLSRGKTATAPSVPYPPAPSKGVSYYHFYGNELMPQYEQDLEAHSQQQIQLLQERGRKPLTGLTAARTNDIVTLILTAASDPALKTLADRYQGAYKAAMGFSGSYDPNTQPTCWPESNHEHWVQLYAKLSAAVKAYYPQWYKHVTGLASNLKDPLSRAIAQSYIDGQSLNIYYSLLSAANAWTFNLFETQGCYTKQDVTPPNPDEAGTPKAVPCPKEAFKVINMLASFIPGVSISGDCEKFTAEISTGGPLGLFGRITYGRNGETTIFAGPKGKVSLGPVGSATAKDGLYIKFGSSGQVTDFGGRFEHSESFGKFSAGDSMDFSLVGVHPIDTVLGRVT